MGNITKLEDTGTELPKNSSFTYDELDRLTSAEITDATTQTTTTESYTYSPAGNILTKTDSAGTKTYHYDDPRHPHAVTRFGNERVGYDSYEYDANGNMTGEVRSGEQIPTSSEQVSYTYDFLNRLIKIANAKGTTTYLYGTGYDRVSKILPSGKIPTSSGQATVYIGELAEVIADPERGDELNV